jgi:hypothetical protein
LGSWVLGMSCRTSDRDVIHQVMTAIIALGRCRGEWLGRHGDSVAVPFLGLVNFISKPRKSRYGRDAVLGPVSMPRTRFAAEGGAENSRRAVTRIESMRRVAEVRSLPRCLLRRRFGPDGECVNLTHFEVPAACTIGSRRASGIGDGGICCLFANSHCSGDG